MRRFIVLAAMVVGCGGHGTSVTELAHEDKLVTHLAADDKGVAWIADAKDENQLKLLDTGGKPTVVAHGTLFSVALDPEHVYWSDGEHVWRSTRDKPTADQIADENDVVRDLQIDGGYLYWALPTKVTRLPLSGGASSVVASAPEGRKLERVAVNGGHIVATVPVENAKELRELWQLDGEPHRVAAAAGIPDALFLDGQNIVWAGLRGSTWQTVVVGLDGHEGAVLDGTAVGARGGTIYVSRDAGTFACDVAGKHETKLGPRALLAAVTDARLVGDFKPSIGSIALRH